MTEPPRPGEGAPGSSPEPTSPPPPSYSVPGEGASPGSAPPPPSAPQYETPPGGEYAPPPPSGDAYGQQPGGYPPPGGYGTPGYGVPGAAPAGYANSEDKTWALVAHFGGALGALISWGTLGWVGPLVAMLARGNQSPPVRIHAVTALNFHILWAIISVVSLALASCLFWLIIPMVLWLVPLVPIIIGVIGGFKANDGQLYRYPMSVSWIK